MGNSQTGIQTQSGSGSPSAQSFVQDLPPPSNLAEATNATKKRCRDALATPPLPQFENLEAKCDYVLDLVVKMMDRQSEVIEELWQVRFNLTASQEQAKKDSSRIVELEKISRADATRISELKYRNRALEDYSRAENLVLHGIPQARTEAEAVGFVISAAKFVGFDITHRDISACHAISTPRNGSGKIICRFVNPWLKDQIQFAVNRAKLTTEDLGLLGDKKGVHATDHLSPEMTKIFAEARRTLWTRFGGSFQFVWSRNRKVLVRRKKGDNTFEIRSMMHLQNL